MFTAPQVDQSVDAVDSWNILPPGKCLPRESSRQDNPFSSSMHRPAGIKWVRKLKLRPWHDRRNRESRSRVLHPPGKRDGFVGCKSSTDPIFPLPEVFHAREGMPQNGPHRRVVASQFTRPQEWYFASISTRYFRNLFIVRADNALTDLGGHLCHADAVRNQWDSRKPRRYFSRAVPSTRPAQESQLEQVRSPLNGLPSSAFDANI